MLLAVTFLLSAILSFALSLTVATLIGPDAFGRYSIALSLSVALVTGCFEWLRLATTRFYSEQSRTDSPSIRPTLDRAYGTIALALTALAGLAALLSASDTGLPGLPAALGAALLGAAVAAAIGTGFTDYRIALARCRFDDALYAQVVIGRGVAGFALAAGFAWFVGDPATILFGWAVGLAAVGLAAIRLAATSPLRDPPGARASWVTLRGFARYAMPLVAAGALYQMLPFINRTVLGLRAGYVEAGYFSLASEIPSRLFQNLGAALDIALFQFAVRAHARLGADEAARQVERNLGLVAALLLPATAGLVAAWPSFERVFLPRAFQTHLGGLVPSLIPAFALFALAQYALGPMFQIRGRTAIVVAAALVALATDVALLALWTTPLQPDSVALVQLIAVGLAVAVLAGAALRQGIRLPWRDLAVAAGSAGTMAAALWPWRTAYDPAPGLALQVVAGLAIYGALALLGDLCGARSAVAQFWSRATKR